MTLFQRLVLRSLWIILDHISTPSKGYDKVKRDIKLALDYKMEDVTYD